MVFSRIKQALLFASVLATGQAQADESVEDLIGYSSPRINSAAEHASCTVHQGDNVTLIACASGYELYETNALAADPVALRNYGEGRPAVGVNKSLATGKEGHLTYLLEGRTVVSAYWD